LATLPTLDIAWQRASETQARRLHPLTEIERVCEAEFEASNNGRQLAGYLRHWPAAERENRKLCACGVRTLSFSSLGLRSATAGGDCDWTPDSQAELSPLCMSHSSSVAPVIQHIERFKK